MDDNTDELDMICRTLMMGITDVQTLKPLEQISTDEVSKVITPLEILQKQFPQYDNEGLQAALDVVGGNANDAITYIGSTVLHDQDKKHLLDQESQRLLIKEKHRLLEEKKQEKQRLHKQEHEQKQQWEQIQRQEQDKRRLLDHEKHCEKQISWDDRIAAASRKKEAIENGRYCIQQSSKYSKDSSFECIQQSSKYSKDSSKDESFECIPFQTKIPNVKYNILTNDINDPIINACKRFAERSNSSIKRTYQVNTQLVYDKERKTVNDNIKTRDDLFQYANELRSKGKYKEATTYANYGIELNKCITEASARASTAIYNAHNQTKYNDFEIEFHGLHVNELNEFIKKTILEFYLLPTNISLKLIFGRGNHSVNNIPILLPAAKIIFDTYNIKYIENIGYLVINLHA